MKTCFSIAVEMNPTCVNNWPVVLLKEREQVAPFMAPWHSVQLPLQLGLGFAFAKCTLGDSLQLIRKESCCLG